jgi:hypothetical protein
MNPEHPPLSKMFNALPLLLMNVRATLDDPTWAQRDQWAYGYRFMFQRGNNPDDLLLGGRLANMFWGLLLLASVYAFSLDRFGNEGAILSLILTVACPSLLAHSHYATMDVCTAALLFLAVVAFLRSIENPTAWRALQCGVLIGGALLAKHSALILLVVLPGIALVEIARSASGGKVPGARVKLRHLWMGAIPVIAFAMIWAAYQFRYSASNVGVDLPWEYLVGRRSVISDLVVWLRSHRLLPEAYLYGVADTDRHTSEGHPAYALGLHSQKGWWWYFPLALILKTPISALVLMAGGIYCGLGPWRPSVLSHASFAVLPAAFMAAALFSKIDIGIRYLLPVFPFLFVLAGGILVWTSRQGNFRWVRLGVLGLAATALVELAVGAPLYLGYMNVPALLIADRHNWLADSNLDWGQDLGRLKRTLEQKGIREIKLAYFGTASPRQLGIQHQILTGYALYTLHEREWKPATELCPGDIVAISVNNLVGLYLEDRMLYSRAFRNLRPIATVGHSILVYEIPKIPYAAGSERP